MSGSALRLLRSVCHAASSLRRTLPLIFVATPALLYPSRSFAQGEKLKWGPAPAVFAPGAKLAVVSGDPSATGPYVVQLSMPANYRIAPHYHPTDEHMKVVHGSFLVGMGDTVNLSKTKRLAVGDTMTAPATVHHFAETQAATIVEVSGMGPFQLTYVNPSDMPKAAKP